MALEGSIEELEKVYTFLGKYREILQEYVASELGMSELKIKNYVKFLEECGVVKTGKMYKQGIGPPRQIPTCRLMKGISLDTVVQKFRESHKPT
jgi:response regulator of citrate/malate metabolism